MEMTTKRFHRETENVRDIGGIQRFKRCNNLLIISICQSELRSDVKMHETKKDWKQESLAPMRYKLDRHGVVIIDRRSRIDELVTR